MTTHKVNPTVPADGTVAVLTLTTNPSRDLTLEMAGPLNRGDVQRAHTERAQPGGKGINVSRVVGAAAGRPDTYATDLPSLALLPAAPADRFLTDLDDAGVAHRIVPVDGEVRCNVTIAEADGTTTKINAPGVRLDDRQAGLLVDLVVEHAARARWVTLCGSLAPGLPDDWYRTVLRELAPLPCAVALDTSGAALRAAADSPVELIKPNDEELAEVTGVDHFPIAAALAAGDLEPVIAAATRLSERTGGHVLATLGATGAVLTGPQSVGTTHGFTAARAGDIRGWFAAPPPIVPRSTVGAGDSSLAGYVLAALDGADEPARLARAVAYGAAATALPGTQAPTPADLDLVSVTVRPLPSTR